MSFDDRMSDFDFHIVTNLDKEREEQLKLDAKIARLAAEADQEQAVQDSTPGG